MLRSFQKASNLKRTIFQISENLGVISHAFNPNIQETGRRISETSLLYTEFQVCQSYTLKPYLENKPKTPFSGNISHAVLGWRTPSLLT